MMKFTMPSRLSHIGQRLGGLIKRPFRRLTAKQNDSLVVKATKYLWKHSRAQFLGISIVIGFLLFFLHLFLTSAYLTEKTSADITKRLGVYFYIVDPGKGETKLSNEEVFTRVIHLKDDLTARGLDVDYYSKEDALKLLQERIPGVIQNFDRYGISNPLPATMYVMFDDNDEFTALSSAVENYTDIIHNIESIKTKGGFGEQQERISNILNLTNFSTAFSIVLMVVVAAMIVSFLVLIITMKCRQFWKNIEVEKLLGAHYMSIKMPFLISIIGMLIGAFIVTVLIVLIVGAYVSGSFQYLFHVSLAQYAGTLGRGNIFGILILEFILLSMVATSIGDRVLTRMIKEI